MISSSQKLTTFAFVFITTLFANLSLSAAAKLQSGPMIGYATMSEVLIWVQTTEPAKVEIRYWEQDNPKKVWMTAPIRTTKQTAYVAKCLADNVTFGKKYGYQVRINGKKVTPKFRKGFRDGAAIPLTFKTPPNWRFREEGHKIFDFTVGLGSCVYINQEGGYDRLNNKTPYGSGYEIFESIYEQDPDIFLWLGDNLYLREPDWTSRTGLIRRWTHDRSLPHMRGLLASRPNYATWDDHDFGPNNSGAEFWNKEQSTEMFSLFFGNPSAGLPETPGIFTFFNYGDVNFYLLDNRTYRTGPENAEPFGTDKNLLGKAQVDWLISTLKHRQDQSTVGGAPSYPSNFNIICVGTPVLADNGNSDSHRSYPTEWQYMMDRIMEEGIDGVVFLTGDVHFSEINMLELQGGGNPGVPGEAGIKGATYRFMDITASPMTSGFWPGGEDNPTRYDIFPGEMDRVGEHNFATLEFIGSLNDRKMVIRYFNTEGVLLNQKEGAPEGTVTDASIISASFLKAPTN